MLIACGEKCMHVNICSPAGGVPAAGVPAAGGRLPATFFVYT